LNFTKIAIDITNRIFYNPIHSSFYNSNEYNIIKKETSFLPDNIKARQRMWHIFNNIKEIPKCKYCNNKEVNWNNHNKYLDFCSPKCSKLYEPNNKITKINKFLQFLKSDNKYKQYLDNFQIDELINLIEKNTQDFLECNTGLAQRFWHFHSKTFENIKCNSENCCNLVNWDTSKNNYNKFCSIKCAQSDKDVIMKRETTCLERFNNTTPLMNLEVQQKIEETNLKKYGVKNHKQTHLLKDKLSNIYDVDWLIDQHHNKKKTITEMSIELGYLNSQSLTERFHNSGIEVKRFPTSIEEQFIFDFISSNYNGDVKRSDRSVINPCELDIYIPDLKLAFEYNGLYWHSQTIKPDKNYHLNKSIECYRQGIRLIHIFENEWIEKGDIVKSRILNMLRKSNRIYARKCKIVNVNNLTKLDFLNSNHIQGNCVSNINIGLEYENQLVSIMTFGKSRFNKNYEYELLRFCNIINHTVIGGASKLLKSFIKSYSPSSIISYADLRYSDGNLYNKLGFDFIRRSPPNYWYFKNGNDMKLYNRVQFQKHKLLNKLEIFDSNLTEYDNMLNNGYHRIFDCGNGVYGMEL